METAAARCQLKNLARRPISPLVATPARTLVQDRSYVARQPIVDDRLQVFGYELLCRGSNPDGPWVGSKNHASARVVDDAVLSIGLETLALGKRAFLNLSRDILLSDALSMLPPDQIVLEILEDVRVDREVIDMCRSLHQRGFMIALDDFEPGSSAEALLPFARIVKVDVRSTPARDWAPLATTLRKYGVRLVAEKVETPEVFEGVKRAGYSLHQGYFFCRPQGVAVRAMSTQQLTQLRLIAALNQPNASAISIEGLIKQDPRLCFRVLRCVNSAAFGLRREIQSIREALMLLGLDQIRKWATIWSLAGMNGGSPELVNMTILRARSCELVGEALGFPDNGAELFLLGLCSLLDVILQRPMKDAVAALPLTASTRDALLGKDGGMRLVLDVITQYERGAWDEANQTAERLGLDPIELRAAYHQALGWSSQISLAAAA
jgi:EAL and modified HD-GYP domain-containing signal transduction protein